MKWKQNALSFKVVMKNLNYHVREITQEKLSKKQKELLELIKRDSTITRETISKETGFSLDSVKYSIDVLRKKGILSRESSTKSGKWVINI